MNYINNQSFRCLLGPRSQNVVIHDNLFLWTVNSKKHFAVQNELTNENIEVLKDYAPSGFHYLNETNLLKLKQHFHVTRSKGTSVILDIRDLNFVGRKNSKIRHALNRCKNLFSLETNYRDIKDVDSLIHEWRSTYADKYFRDNSGKNLFFYKNNFHRGLISIFVYKENSLVAFGSLSSPVNGYSSYVLGKALFKRHYGLSEFADVELYKMAQKMNVNYINMGSATKGLLKYKTKFNGYTESHFDGKIINEI